MSKRKSSEKSAVRRILLGTVTGFLIGILMLFLLLILFAALQSGLGIPASAVDPIGAVCVILAAAISSFLTGVFFRERGMPIGLGCGVCWGILLMVGNRVIYHGAMLPISYIKLVCVVLLSIAGGMLGVSLMRAKEKKRYGY